MLNGENEMAGGKRNRRSWTGLFACLFLVWNLSISLGASAAEESGVSVFESARFRVSAAEGSVKNLKYYAEMCEEALDRLAPDFELRKPNREKIEARVCATRKEFQRASGHSGGNTMAVAIPGKGVMILNGEALLVADPAERFRTVGHEMVHLLLGRLAAGEATVPGWLHEGLAQLLTGDYGRMASIRLAWANLRDKRIPMKRLADDFPYGTPLSELAYAQSASFTQFVTTEHIPFKSTRDFFGELLGNPEQARQVFGWLGQSGNLSALEARWREQSSGASNWIYIVTSGTVLWAGIVVLFLVAYARKRRKMKEVMEDWDSWEREDY